MDWIILAQDMDNRLVVVNAWILV